MAFTLNKTALGETALVAYYGDANEVLVNDTGLKLVDNVFISSMGWYILYMLAALFMLFGTILGHRYGKRAGRLQQLAMQANIASLAEEAEKWKQKWLDTDTDMAKALQELIDTKVALTMKRRSLWTPWRSTSWNSNRANTMMLRAPMLELFWTFRQYLVAGCLHGALLPPGTWWQCR